MNGVGDHIHRIIERRFGESITAGCNCQSWIDKLNNWGPAKCRRRIGEITEHLRAEAMDRGWRIARLPGARWGIKTTIVLPAIRRAEREV